MLCIYAEGAADKACPALPRTAKEVKARDVAANDLKEALPPEVRAGRVDSVGIQPIYT